MIHQFPNQHYQKAYSIYSAEGFDWLRSQIKERSDNVKDSILGGDGCDSFEEYQYLLGIVGGMRVLEDVLEDFLDLETGEPYE